MRIATLIVAALLTALPVQAQEDDLRGSPLLPFLEQFSDRTEEMMRELLEDLGPEMERLMGEMMPRLQELSEALGGLVHYEMPEILPNGDIIIRRKKDAPPLPEDFLKPNDPVDL